MHAFTPSFLRPSSSASSPAPPAISSQPDSAVAVDPLPPLSRPSSRGPLNRLALTTRKRPAVTPAPNAMPTLVQDGSYLEALSLKWSEAVSKALAQPTGAPATGEVLWNGKRAMPIGRGTALGVLIASELEASASNSHLHRAILRSLHRPLSVLLMNLSAQLLPIVSSPQFTVHPSPVTPTAVQLHAIAYATFAAELIESLDMRGLGQENQGVGVAADNLRSIREGLESLVGRVIIPLAYGIRSEFLPVIEALENIPPLSASPPTHTKQSTSHVKVLHVPLHPSIMVLQSLVLSYTRSLVRYTAPPTATTQTVLATLLIPMIWRGLVALSHRAPVSTSCTTLPKVLPQPSSPTSSKKKMGSSTTPSTTPPSTMRFSIKPPLSRTPSPPAVVVPPPAADARALYDVLTSLPRPSANSRHVLAREAVDEAFGSLAALCDLLNWEAADDQKDLDVLTADLPTVIALPVLLRIFAGQEPVGRDSTEHLIVPLMLGLAEQDYREICLSGFGKAEECGPFVAKRVLDSLVEQQATSCDRFVRWLEGRASFD